MVKCSLTVTCDLPPCSRINPLFSQKMSPKPFSVKYTRWKFPFEMQKIRPLENRENQQQHFNTFLVGKVTNCEPFCVISRHYIYVSNGSIQNNLWKVRKEPIDLWKKLKYHERNQYCQKLHYVWTVGTQIAGFVIAVALLGFSVCGGVWIHGTFRKLHLITKNCHSFSLSTTEFWEQCEKMWKLSDAFFRNPNCKS